MLSKVPLCLFYQLKDTFQKILPISWKNWEEQKKKKKTQQQLGALWHKSVIGFLKLYPIFSISRTLSSKKILFLDFTDILCSRTELEKHPFSLIFRTHMLAHDQWQVTPPGTEHCFHVDICTHMGMRMPLME